MLFRILRNIHKVLRASRVPQIVIWCRRPGYQANENKRGQSCICRCAPDTLFIIVHLWIVIPVLSARSHDLDWDNNTLSDQETVL